MKIHALQFHVERVDAPTDDTVFLIVWPEESGNGRYCHHSHPDKTVMDAKAGDVLVHKKRVRYRIKAVKVFRSSLCLDDTAHEWCGAVGACPLGIEASMVLKQ